MRPVQQQRLQQGTQGRPHGLWEWRQAVSVEGHGGCWSHVSSGHRWWCCPVCGCWQHPGCVMPEEGGRGLCDVPKEGVSNKCT